MWWCCSKRHELFLCNRGSPIVFLPTSTLGVCMTVEQLESVAREVCQAHNYEFDQYVNEGTFKATFHVVAPDGSSLALKVFKPGFSAERTAREIDAMKQFNHPNIGRLIAIGTFQSSWGE